VSLYAFTELFVELDSSTSTKLKTNALERYLKTARMADAAWAVFLLAGGRPRQAVPTRVLRTAALEATRMEAWLFEECYQAVGDLAETLALVLPNALGGEDQYLSLWLTESILPLRGQPEAIQSQTVQQYWARLPPNHRFVLNKLLTGGFRVGVSRQIVLRAIAQAFDLDVQVLAQRFIGYTDREHQPDESAWQRLIEPIVKIEGMESTAAADRLAADGRPLPFFLAQSLREALEDNQSAQAVSRLLGERSAACCRATSVALVSRRRTN
jgi:DNA ligase 1